MNKTVEESSKKFMQHVPIHPNINLNSTAQYQQAPQNTQLPQQMPQIQQIPQPQYSHPMQELPQPAGWHINVNMIIIVIVIIVGLILIAWIVSHYNHKDKVAEVPKITDEQPKTISKSALKQVRDKMEAKKKGAIVDKTSANEPADKTISKVTLVDKTPVEKTTLDKIPVDKTPVDKTSADKTPADKTTVTKSKHVKFQDEQDEPEPKQDEPESKQDDDDEDGDM